MEFGSPTATTPLVDGTSERRTSIVRFHENTYGNIRKEDCYTSVMKTRSDSALSDASSIGSSINSSRHRKIPYINPQLHDALLRKQSASRNPYDIYEVVDILGVGSMGSVSKVKKRDYAIGGSARDKFVYEMNKKGLGYCFQLPLVGFILRFCTGREEIKNTSSSHHNLFTPFSTESHHGDNSTRGDNNNQKQQQQTQSLSPQQRQTPIYRKQTSSIISYSNKKTTYYALKSLELDKISDPIFIEELKNEVDILKTLDHPNVVKALEVFNYKKSLYLVMELCSGGDLYTRDPYTEEQAAQIVISVLSALSYLHAQGIIHRDLKYENIIFVNNKPKSDVKLIDFGLSKYSNPNSLSDNEDDNEEEQLCGTVYTMAPELLKGKVASEASDMWSVGVIAYMLLSSQMPFYGRKRKHVISRILNGGYSFTGRKWKKYVSIDAKNFVSTLLKSNPKERPTADQASNLQWLVIQKQKHSEEEQKRQQRRQQDQNMIEGDHFNRHGDELGAFSDDDPSNNDNSGSNSTGNNNATSTHDNILLCRLDAVQASIQQYSTYSTLKQLALMVIAHKSTNDEIGFLRNMFHTYDTDHNGIISYEDFKNVIGPYYKYDDDELQAMFTSMDLDGTDTIHYTEFLAATIEATGSINEERLAEAFDLLDCDDSGYITTNNIRTFLGQQMPLEYIDQIIDEVDLTRNHKIDYDEFLELWNIDLDLSRNIVLNDVIMRRQQSSALSLESTASVSLPSTPMSTPASSFGYEGAAARGEKQQKSSPKQLLTDNYKAQVNFTAEKAKSVCSPDGMRTFDI